MQVLFDLEPTQRFNSILSGIDIHPILDVVMKKTRFGPKQSLNYSAMIYSLIIRITEPTRFIKDLVKRLDTDLRFKVDCGFLVSDEIPSEASYSRMITLISESNALEDVQERLLYQAILEGFVSDETIALDVTHVESRAPIKTDKVKKEPQKRGRKKKPVFHSVKRELSANWICHFRSFAPLYLLNPNGESRGIVKGRTSFGSDLSAI